jgi:predicted dehydrogenase
VAKIKVGIVGTGGMANTHAKSYAKIKDADLNVCFDLDTGRAEEFARQHQVTHCASSMEELIDRSDAVSVVTPDAHHAAISLQVLKSGKHLLCEKPLTSNLADARRVARAAKGATRNSTSVHMINFSYRDSSAVQEAIKMVERGDLGEIRHVHGGYLQSWLAADGWGHWQQPSFLWRLQTAKGSAGVLGDLGCHLLDLVTVVAGDIDALDCTLATFPKLDKRGRRRTKIGKAVLDANDSAMMRLHFANGAQGLCHTTRWATGHKNSVNLSVHGTTGALRIDLEAGYDKLFLCLGADRHRQKWRTKTIRSTPNIYQRFIRSIQTGRLDQPDVIRGAQVQSYLDACERSAQRGGGKTPIKPWF